MIIPSRSHHNPKHHNQLPKADMRRETTAFRLLVWTYADERVRAMADGAEYGDGLSYGSTVLGRLIDGVEGSGRGTINGLIEIHEDALMVDSLVWAWYDHRPDYRAYLATHLERRVPPPHPSTLEPQRRVPRLKPNGKPHILYDNNRHAIGVLEDVVGYDAKQMAYADLHYRLFVGLLDVLKSQQLTKWKVTGRGLTVCEESLTRDSTV